MQNLKKLGENINRQKELKKENIKTRRKTFLKKKKQKYRISSSRTSANKSHKLFVDVRGLDILYFFFVYVFIIVFLLFLCFFMFFLFSPSLFKLLHSQSNKRNIYIYIYIFTHSQVPNSPEWAA